MGESDDARRRRVHMDNATKMVTGIDPSRATGTDAKQAQRFQIANFVRQIYDAKYDPMTIIEMLLAGAAFVGDNHGVSREQMAAVIVAIKMREDRQLVWTP